MTASRQEAIDKAQMQVDMNIQILCETEQDGTIKQIIKAEKALEKSQEILELLTV